MSLSETDRIVEAITARIRDGVLKPGDALPTYALLAEEFAVSESTVTRAMLVLRARGLVVGWSGKGTFVASPGASA